MDLGLNNKLALVTASSGGIGLAIARSLAAEGAKVAVNGRTKQSVDKAVAKIRADVPAADLIPLVADNATAKGCAATIGFKSFITFRSFSVPKTKYPSCRTSLNFSWQKFRLSCFGNPGATTGFEFPRLTMCWHEKLALP